MRLHSLTVKNYRCFEDETIVFEDYNCLVGANGSGKSTILMALNVFFRNTDAPMSVVTLTEDDFHNRNTSVPIEITATFRGLSDDARTDFRAYVRQREVIITSKAIWNPEAEAAEVLQYGSRNVLKDFASYFEADEGKAKVSELKEIFVTIRQSHPDVPDANTKEAMRTALREYEESHPELCEPLESPNQFYGWSRGSNLLGKYVQWVYIPAIKDPASEQDEQKNTALGKLLERSVRAQVDFSEPINALRQDAVEKYQSLLAEENKILGNLGDALQEKLRVWAHPGAQVRLTWHYDENKSVVVADPYARVSVGEGHFLGEIARAGHGFQRSFLLALLQVLADTGETTAPTLLLGFEEPELYQHPPQARHLARF